MRWLLKPAFLGLSLPALGFVALCCVLAAAPLQAQGSSWESLIKGAEAALERKDFAAAEEQLKAALAAAEHFPSGDPRLGKTLNNLAAIYYAQGDYGRAEPLLRRGIEAMERALGPDDPDLAQALKNLAALYYLQGNFGAAEPLLTRSLAIWERAVGTEHPYVATLLSNLAGLYQAQGRYNRAEPLLVRSLKIWEALLGPNHADVAKSREMLERLQTAMAGETRSALTGETGSALTAETDSALTGKTPPAPKPRPTTAATTTTATEPQPQGQLALSSPSQEASPNQQATSAQDRAGSPSERHSAVIAFSRTAIKNDQASSEAASKSAPSEEKTLFRETETTQTAKAPEPETARPAATKNREAAVPTGDIALYLSSFRTREDAEGHWLQLQKDFPGLAQKELLVEEVTMAERGTFFRMLATPFEDQSAAQALCRTLKKKRQDCRVIQQ